MKADDGLPKFETCSGRFYMKIQCVFVVSLIYSYWYPLEWKCLKVGRFRDFCPRVIINFFFLNFLPTSGNVLKVSSTFSGTLRKTGNFHSLGSRQNCLGVRIIPVSLCLMTFLWKHFIWLIYSLLLIHVYSFRNCLRTLIPFVVVPFALYSVTQSRSCYEFNV